MRLAHLFLAVAVCLLHHTNGLTDDELAELFDRLMQAFQDIRAQVQFSVLYLPPPGTLDNLPLLPYLDGNVHQSGSAVPAQYGNITYPFFPNQAPLSQNFDHNYFAATLDRQGRTYRSVLQRRKRDIHTEQLSLHMALTPMLNSFQTTHQTHPEAILLYTYFLPCPNCVTIIQNAINSNTFNVGGHNIPLYVGYTELQGDTRGESIETTTTRRDQLANMLNEQGGRLIFLIRLSDQCQNIPRPKRHAAIYKDLYDLKSYDDYGTYVKNNSVQEVFNKVEEKALTREWNANQIKIERINASIGDAKNLRRQKYHSKQGTGKRPRIKRNAIAAHVQIKMDFENGSARAQWYMSDIDDYAYSYVKLINKNGEQKAWFWISQKEGNQSFDAYIEAYDKVQFYKGTIWSRNQLVYTSHPWQHCGFGWRRLSKVPEDYGRVFMSMAMVEGKPKIGLAYCDWDKSTDFIAKYGSDKVILQTVDGTNEDDKQNEQSVLVQDMSPHQDQQRFPEHSFERLTNAYADGFRVKYLLYTTSFLFLHDYDFGHFEDNALPFWEPEKCSGTHGSCDPAPFHYLTKGDPKIYLSPCRASSIYTSYATITVMILMAYIVCI